MKNNKKQKRFYNSKHRGQKWTEQPQGRPIDFAEKYAENGGFSDKFDETRPVFNQSKTKQKQKREKIIKRVVAAVLAFVLIGAGYTGMDVYITRHAKPVEELLKQKVANGSFAEISLDFSSVKVESVSFDNSTMLSAVISSAQNSGCSSVCFDAKRDDGTIGYQSNLATIDTFNTISNGGSDTKGSIKKLIDNDMLPVARIACYKDNILPQKDDSLAIKKGKKLYQDKDGNTYLNPNNQNVYGYISDIIRELYGYGVRVFVLYDCDLPEDVADKYNDGFENLSKRLTTELNKDVKILQQVDVTVDGKDPETGKIKNSAISKDIDNFEKLKDNQLYYISTNIDNSRVIEQLSQKGVSRFIIGE